MKKNKFKFSLTFFALLCVNIILAQTTIRGTVKDAETNEPIPGANIIIQGTNVGTTTDFDGNFVIVTSQTPPFTMDASNIGFSSQSIVVSSADQSLSFSLQPGENLDEIIISASRRPQKVQEAPASVSVISSKDIENSAVAVDPVRHLMNVPGVQLQQQSVNTINIEMRSAGGVFGTSAFPILDYRFLSTPAAGTFFTQQSGLSNIDLARIEVVRGAASALYGPSVTSGVVHFISKNPIDHPGTTVELIRGTLDTRGAAIRHAFATDDKKFGYKINAKWSAGNDFQLDPVEDADIIAGFQREIYQPVTENNVIDPTRRGELLLDLYDGNPLATEYENFSVNAHLEFRPNETTSAFLSSGYAKGGALFFNSQGAGFQDGQDFWLQGRIQSGGLFAQVFYNNNDGGDENNPTFLYNSGFRQVAERSSLDAQIQYNFDIPSFLNSNFTVGIDHRNIKGNSDYTLYGRNDDNDDYIITGAYLQGTSELTDKLELTYAARYDNFNILDEAGFSPRVALVYKANDKNTFRASYNLSTGAPAALQSFIDFPVSVIIPGAYDVWLAGDIEEQNFAPNAPIALPAFGGATIPQGSTSVPNAYLYGAVAPASIEGMNAAYAALPQFASIRGLGTALGIDFNAILNQAFAGYTPGGTFGNLTPYNLFTGDVISGEPLGTGKAELATVGSFEVGYNGVIGDKLKVMVDFYTYDVTGFTNFTAIGPTFNLTGFDSTAFGAVVGTDIGNAVAGPVATALTTAYTNIAASQGLTLADVAGGVPALGLPPLAATIASVAGGLGQLAGGTFIQGAQGFEAAAGALFPAFGTIESLRAPADNVTHIAAGYRHFPDVKRNHVGVDVGFEYFANDVFTIWGNASWLSQNEWIPGEPDSDGVPVTVALNAPLFKYRAGVMFTKDNVYGGLTFQHDDEFNSNQGVWSGLVQEKNLFDANIGVSLTEKLRFDITGSNIFNFEYRAFPGMPVIGRRIIGKITFDL